jgi:archaellum component FlaC
MFDAPETEEEIEFRIDMIRNDIENEQSYIKSHYKALSVIDSGLQANAKNLKYLKLEAPVVSMADFTFARDEKRRLLDSRKTIVDQIAKNQKQIESYTKDLAYAERDLLKLRGAVRSATILEFPNANSRRDPSTDQ